jgi:hypothetical protein
VAHDVGRKPMMFVALWNGWRSHAGFPRRRPVRLITLPVSQR